MKLGGNGCRLLREAAIEQECADGVDEELGFEPVSSTVTTPASGMRSVQPCLQEKASVRSSIQPGLSLSARTSCSDSHLLFGLWAFWYFVLLSSLWCISPPGTRERKQPEVSEH